jgi:CheY-like chemotaxis protein
VSPSDISKATHRTVLVVDDDPDVRRLLQSILTEEDYEVVVAASADAAIKAYERLGHRPDLLLVDVVMPGMSGPMLVDYLRGIEPDLKVLFISAYDRRNVVKRYVVDKGFQLISKPFTVISLRMAIEAITAATEDSDPAARREQAR